MSQFSLFVVVGLLSVEETALLLQAVLVAGFQGTHPLCQPVIFDRPLLADGLHLFNCVHCFGDCLLLVLRDFSVQLYLLGQLHVLALQQDHSPLVCIDRSCLVIPLSSQELFQQRPLLFLLLRLLLCHLQLLVRAIELNRLRM
jgi:hypothetical protein